MRCDWCAGMLHAPGNRQRRAAASAALHARARACLSTRPRACASACAGDLHAHDVALGALDGVEGGLEVVFALAQQRVEVGLAPQEFARDLVRRRRDAAVKAPCNATRNPHRHRRHECL